MQPQKPLRYIISFFLAVVAALPLGAKPLSPTRWYSISTPHVDLIFRGGMGYEAQRLANTLDHLYGPVTQSLGAHPAPIPLVLWNQWFEFNGVTTPVPRKIDFYTSPPPGYNLLGINDWLDLLAVHEFRHAVQYAKLGRNVGRLSYWPAVLVPAWFMEGDAVGIETALTRSGRGRIPYFSVLYKANLLERGGFSYLKQVFSSFKHAIPNHYRVGYYMTTYLRRKYGAEVLANILENSTRLMPFPIAVKKATGKRLLQIYEDTNQELKDLWQKQLKGLKLTPVTSITTRTDETYTDYKYPQYLDEKGNLIVLKSGLGTVDQFVMVDAYGEEHPMFVPRSIHYQTSFSVAKGQIVWTESVPHPIRRKHSYGVIQRYDIAQKQLKKLTHRSRYNTAALSPDATKIVAVESDTNYRHRLVILDADDGKVLRRMPNPDNYFYLTPKWLANGRLVVAVKHHQQKATLTLIDTLTGESKDLIPYSEENIGTPVPYGQYIFYNSAYNGIDNIYALNLDTHQRYQVTSRKYGAYNPTISADGRWIVFNDFTKDGMDVVKMPFAPQEWTPLEKVEDRSIHYYAPLLAQENKGEVLNNISNKTYPVAPYYPWNSLSRNLLDTTEFKFDYPYNVKKDARELYGKLTYKGWYPIMTLKYNLEKYYKKKATKKEEDQKEVSLTFQLPLTFHQGQYANTITLSTESDFNYSFTYLSQSYQGTLKRSSPKSPRDLHPPWRQSLSISYTHTPYRKERVEDCQSPTWEVKPSFRFPGLFKHHSLRLAPIYEREQKITVKNTCKVTAAYDWPIAYPEWNLANLLYVKRLSGSLFYTPKYTSKGNVEHQVGLLAKLDIGFYYLTRLPFVLEAKVTHDKNKGFNITPYFYLSNKREE